MAIASSEIGTADIETAAYDVERVREDFPLLRQTIDGQPLAYLDNAATTQKPQPVIDALMRFYTEDCSNIHRSVHRLGERATEQYEAARGKVRKFLNAASEREIVFVRGTTEAINLVAQSFRSLLAAGDEVLITGLEHHSNIVPWQLACEATGAKLKVAPLNERGEVDLDAYRRLLNPRTRITAFAHISNALGTVNPIAEMIRAAHAQGVPVLVDGAQAAPHLALDVRALDCEFYAISGHKMYGPTGIGALYGKQEWLERLPPWQGGGDMIRSVTFEKTTYNELPYKFEAGTPNIAGTIGLGAACDYLQALGRDRIARYEHTLLAYGTELLAAVPGLRMVGTAAEKAGVLSFTMNGVHPHDVGTVLDSLGVAVRAGHHCAQPVMDRFEIPATTRASLGLYNTRAELDRLAAGLRRVEEMFR
ncbi:MAG TPA: cysteine desulfurase [Terriglobales bacterium]|nr:cysteine desulfurase [Terriglobales bacterium]